MTRIEKLNEVQDVFVQALQDNNFRGTLLVAPGVGKSFCFIKSLYRMLEQKLIPAQAKVVFLAETVVREKTIWEDEIPKFNNIYSKDILSDFDIVFHCYQSQPDILYNDFKDVDVVICDELQDLLTSKYYTILSNNKCKYIIGLTGSMAMEQNIFPDRVPDEMLNEVTQSEQATQARQITDFITKGQLLEMFCPVVFKYTTNQAIEDGVISEFKTFIIEHQLDNTNKAIQTWKSYATLGTEEDYYGKRKQQVLDWRKPKYVKLRVSREMAQFLYDLPSKINVTKAILARLGNEKTLIFGERLEPLSKITPNVVTDKNYKELIDKFNSGEINVIASSKMLKQGITLDGVQNIIFHSYNSKQHNTQQKRARVRWLDGGTAKLFFIVTQGTYEEKWYTKLKIEKDSQGKTVNIHDMKEEKTIKSSTLLSWYKNQK